MVTINSIEIDNNKPFVLIAGPCQIEDMEHSLMMAKSISNICKKLDIPYIFKSSFDKANRTSAKGVRGVGREKSLEIFSAVKKQIGCPILTDVHSEEDCRVISQVADILQIPAFLCRQTDLLRAAAETKKIVNVKKGQFLAPWDAKNIVEKVKYFGNEKVMLTERGASFGYNTLVSDMRSLVIMAETGAPVIFDATHSVQNPGGRGASSGGDRRFVSVLARAAVAVGVAGLFMEVHQDPDNAPSDGPCMLELQNLENLLVTLKKIDVIAKEL